MKFDSTNQKRYPDVHRVSSSVWHFGAHLYGYELQQGAITFAFADGTKKILALKTPIFSLLLCSCFVFNRHHFIISVKFTYCRRSKIDRNMSFKIKNVVLFISILSDLLLSRPQVLSFVSLLKCLT